MSNNHEVESSPTEQSTSPRPPRRRAARRPRLNWWQTGAILFTAFLTAYTFYLDILLPSTLRAGRYFPPISFLSYFLILSPLALFFVFGYFTGIAHAKGEPPEILISPKKRSNMRPWAVMALIATSIVGLSLMTIGASTSITCGTFSSSCSDGVLIAEGGTFLALLPAILLRRSQL